MEFEEQEEEIEMHRMEAGNSAVRGNEGVLTAAVAVSAVRKGGASGVDANSGVTYRYKECLKNHAVGIGGQAVDGCGEFMAAGGEGTLDALKCAACNCHRNFHRKEIEGEGFHHHHPSSTHHHQYSFRSPHPSGYLHLTPPSRPLALPSISSEDEDMSNPSSSGGGGRVGSGLKKRTKFTRAERQDVCICREAGLASTKARRGSCAAVLRRD